MNITLQFTAIILICVTCLATLTSTKVYAKSPLDHCLKDSYAQLILINRKDRKKLYKHFLKSIDSKRLGSRTYGGNTWKHFSPDEKSMGLELYFNLIFRKGSEKSKSIPDPKKVKIVSNLASNPVVKPSTGVLHILVTITVPNEDSITAALLMTNNCKLVDVSQRKFVSRMLDASDVEHALRNKRKTS